MIDEKSRRKPDWVEGEWLTLGDGQDWCLPKPVLFARPTRYKRKFGGEKDARQLGRPIALDGDPYFSLMERVAESNDGNVTLELAFEMFVDLIGRNYTLTEDEAADLLPFVGDSDGEQDDDNAELWRDVLDVAMGRGKKACPGGTGS